jgi:hypothetical protein
MITIKIILCLIMNSFRRFIMNICLFFSIYKEHPMKTENELENKQKKRGAICNKILQKKN